MEIGYKKRGVGSREWGMAKGNPEDHSLLPTPHSPFPVASRGSTLLEILVATAILGTAVAALFGLLSSSLGNAQKLQAPSQALLLGKSFMNQLIAESTEVGVGAAVSTPLDQ